MLGRAGWRCEVCERGEDRNRQPGPRWLEVHERWAYDSERLVQTLRRLICLCTDCHTTTHYGLAGVRGRASEAFAHLRAVTGMSESDAEVHVASAWKLWEQRSRCEWTLDLGMLADAGVTVTRPKSASERAAEAAAQTAVVRGQGGMDPDDAEVAAAEAVELVRQIRGAGLPVEDTSPVRVRVQGGHEVEVDPRGL